MPPNLKKRVAMTVLRECTCTGPGWIYKGYRREQVPWLYWEECTAPSWICNGYRREQAGVMAVLREMYSPRVGSIKVQEKNSCHYCTERNVQLTAHKNSQRVDLFGLKEHVPWLYWEGCAVYCTSHSQRLDLLVLKKRTGVMTILRGMYSVLHITQPKVGSIRVKEKNRCHGCSVRNVHCTVYCISHSQRLDLLGLRKRKGAKAVLRGMYSYCPSHSQRLDLFLWGMYTTLYSVLHITQPKVGSIRVKEKNRCHGCTERTVQCTAHNTAKRLDLLGLRKRTGAMAVLRGLYSTVYCTPHSQRLDLLGFRKRTGAMAVLRGL